MATNFQEAIRAELEGRKRKIEEQLSLKNFDKYVAYGVEKGLITEMGIIIRFDFRQIRRAMARELLEQGDHVNTVALATELPIADVMEIAGYVRDAEIAAYERKRITDVCVPGALELNVQKLDTFSSRTVNVLLGEGVRVVGDFLDYSLSQIKKWDGCGPKAYGEIVAALTLLNVQLKP